MKRLILVVLLSGGNLAASRAEVFERAEVVKAFNLVSLLPQSKRAVPGDIIKGNTGLKTGGDSRAELQFPDLTITRVGSNSLFRFVAGTREIILDSGTMLFSAPAGAGGGTVRAGFISAAVTGSDFMISNVGRVKVICLSHKVTVYLTANPKIRTELRPGQMLDVAAGADRKMPRAITRADRKMPRAITRADRKMPRATTINLGKLLATSKLTESGGFRPLSSQPILAQNTNRQVKAFSLAKKNLTSESAEAVDSTTETAEVVRSTTESANNSSAQSRQTAAAQTAHESAAPTSAAPTVDNAIVGDQAKSTNNENRSGENLGNSGNKENPGNSGNKENRGNSGIKENPGNSSNKENRGNSGNKGQNPGNRSINENRGNGGNNGNPGNRSINENRGNGGNNGNPGNRSINENRGNGGINGNPGNRSINENRGNGGNNGNPGNRGINENRGNGGINGNPGNRGINENRGNGGINGNPGNRGINENRGNGGNNGNPGNRSINENRGNGGNENRGNRAG